MKSRKPGIFNVMQIFLRDGDGLEAKTELIENVESGWQVMQVFLLNGNGLLK